MHVGNGIKYEKWCVLLELESLKIYQKACHSGVSRLPGKTFTACYSRDKISLLVSYAMQMKFQNTPHFHQTQVWKGVQQMNPRSVVCGVIVHFHKLCIFLLSLQSTIFFFVQQKRQKMRKLSIHPLF